MDAEPKAQTGACATCGALVVMIPDTKIRYCDHVDAGVIVDLRADLKGAGGLR